MTAAPFDDIRTLLQDMPSAAPAVAPDPGLGRLGEIAAFVHRWRGQATLHRPIVALYAGSTGADPDAVRASLEAVASGAAPVARLAQAQGAGLEAFDLAIERPVADMAHRPAMSDRECAATMAFGMEALAKQPDLLMPGVLGDDDGAAAAAVAMALYGGEATDWTADHAPRVAAAVHRFRDKAGPAPDPLEALGHLGSRQMAAVAGAIVAARVQGVPVLLDGYAACVAAGVLHALDLRALDHCLAAHVSADHGHAAVLQRLGLRPLVDLELAGEGGLGAVAALAVVKAAMALK